MDFVFNARAWYWKADDGRIYSGASGGLVPSTDADYVAFIANVPPNQWPRDAQGNQTNAALQEVLSTFGLFADLVSYAADARWRKEVGGITVNTIPVATDDRSKQMLMGARLAADANSAFSTTWVGADGNSYPLTAAQIVGLSNAVLNHVNNCFSTYSSIASGVAGGTITTRAQVDAQFAAIQTTVTA